TFDGATAYPLLRGGQLYGLVDGERQEKTVALESGTGRVRWSHHGEFHGPAKDGGIYMGRGSRIARIAADGSVVWQSALGIRQPSEREFWRQYGDSFLAWTRAAFVTLDASTGETRRRIEGLDTLDGPARSYAAGPPNDDRVLLDFRDHVSAVRL
ncbi:MAG: hypothetical protein ABEI99_03275, partial [Halobaculum sp.]